MDTTPVQGTIAVFAGLGDAVFEWNLATGFESDFRSSVPNPEFTGLLEIRFVLGPLPPGITCRSDSGVFPECDGPSLTGLVMRDLEADPTELFRDQLIGPVSPPVGTVGEVGGEA